MEQPRTTPEFNCQFSTEEASWEYLVKLRWPRKALLPPSSASGSSQPQSLRCHHKPCSRPGEPKTQPV